LLSFFPVVAHAFGHYERAILFSASSLAGALIVVGIIVLVAIGGNDAHLMIRNNSPWPVGVSSINNERTLIPSQHSKELFVPAGPGWIDGLIDDVVILAGPSRSTRIELHGITGLEHGTLTIETKTSQATERSNGRVAAH
jgi:hypothetical protein